MEEKIKSLKLTATRLALFERKLGTPLTKLTANDLGIDATVKLLEAAGLTDEEIDRAAEEMGVEPFAQAAMEVLLNCGLFKQAKQTRESAPAKKTEAKADK